MPTSLELANRILTGEIRLQTLYSQLDESLVEPRYNRALSNLRNYQSQQISILNSLIDNLETEQPFPPEDRYYAQHIIQEGENLRIIALQYDTTVSAIRAVNPALPQNPLPGQIINLPIEIPEPPDDSFRYIVKRGDTLWEISSRFNTNIETLVRLNSIQDPDVIFPGRILIIPL